MGQNRKELEEKRKQLLEEINQTTTLLEETQKNKASTLDRYFALRSQIEKRQQLVNTLREEINYADSSIVRANIVIIALDEDVGRLKTEYSMMLRTAYRMKVNKSLLQFLFSAKGFNDAFRRWQYVRQYDRYRKQQAALITGTQETLLSKMQQLETKKIEKEKLLGSEEQQKAILGKELATMDVLIKTIKGDENRLVTELKKQQNAHQQLNDVIEKIIRGEMAKKRKEARTPEALVKHEPSADDHISGNFYQNKGNLPWPVSQGMITRNFGTQAHPTVKAIKITNNGVDIRTNAGSKVFAIFAGKVAGTQYVPGYQNMVIVQHGQYYTVYSNLEELFVKRGDQLDIRQAVGTVGTDKPELHFEVWREKQRLNPVHWIKKQ
ncbi:MAG: peptidase M23 [Saprospiraceae bacterium]|nr:MAG: peptidase M23 [Saprospiraceae bacterium]